MSRNEAISRFSGQGVSKALLAKGIESKATNWEVLAEEAPEAYKNVDDVIDTVHGLGISKKIIRMEPLGVLKG
jgi:tRNA-splicing ligase RtcB